jgi:hypothetical protein
MAKKPKPQRTSDRRTWDGLLEDDVTGADEAEEAQMIEFARKRKPKKERTRGEGPDKPAQ